MVEQGIAPERIRLIPCGLRQDIALKPCATRDRLRAVRSQGIRILMCIGSVTASKNQRLLVEAVSRLGHRDDILAVFVGEGGEALEALAESRGVSSKALCLGYQPHADALLAEADGLVMPSLNEGQGVAVLEAYRARVPVIASDIPPLVELVTDNETGVTFRSNDVEALAAAIERVLDLSPADRSRLVGAARVRFETTYTLPQMVAAHESLYRELYSQVGSCP
jgi:glycosyltransferase involved in cell wall biosynthesis